MKPFPRRVALALLVLASALGIAAFSRVFSRRARSPEPPVAAPAPETTSPVSEPSVDETPRSPAVSRTAKRPVVPASPQTAAPPAVPARTAVATTGDVETKRRFRGFTEVDPVEIVPRVRGFLESIEFQPGALVEAGDVLFRVEAFDYQNELDAAKAELAAALAREARAKAAHQRNLRLRDDKSVAGVVTEETLEESQTAWRAANAESAKARARLAAAQKQLERTVVRAPCRGQISRPFYPIGTFLDGSALDPPVLATIVAMDPMLVYFYATDREFLEFQRRRRDALKSRLGERYDEKGDSKLSLREALQAENLPDYIDFEARFPGVDDEDVYSRRGVVDYVDNAIDRSTGVVALRGEIPNPDYSIYPGAVCEVALSDEPVKNATLIDVKAVCNDLNSQFVWVVDENDVPRRRTVELGRKTEDGAQVVAKSGVKPGERYVVDGVLNLRPGTRIVEAAPRPGSLDGSVERETAVASSVSPASPPDAESGEVAPPSRPAAVSASSPTDAPSAPETFRAAKPVVPAPAVSPDAADSAFRPNFIDAGNAPNPAPRPNDANARNRLNLSNDANRAYSPSSLNRPYPSNSPGDANRASVPNRSNAANRPDAPTVPKRPSAPDAAKTPNVRDASRSPLPPSPDAFSAAKIGKPRPPA